MALAFRSGATSSAGGASGAALVVNRPAGTADGDLMVAVTYLETDTNTWTAPSGWNTSAALIQTNTGAFKLQVFWKIAASEPSTWTWTPGVTAWRTIVVACYTGAVGTEISRVDVVGGSQGDAAILTAQTAPSIATLTDADLVVFGYGNFSGTDTSAMTGFASNLRISSGGVVIADAEKTTAGATGTSRPSTGPGTEDYAAIHVAFKVTTVAPTLAATGAFDWASSDTVSTTKTITPGFAAKVVILVIGGNSSTVDNVVRPSAVNVSFGVACNKGTPTQHVSAAVMNGASGGNQAWGTLRADSLAINAFADASTVGRLGDPVFNSTTVDFTIQAQGAQNVRVSWLAIGGADLTDYAVIAGAVPGAPGTLDLTGLGFNPINFDTVALVFGGRNAGGSLPLSQNGCSLSIGVATNTDQAVAGYNDTAARLATSIGHSGEVFSIDDGASTDVGARASFTQWITDGLRLTFAEVSSSSAFLALVMKGPQWRIGEFTTPAGTGPFTAISGIPAVRGLLMLGSGAAESTPGTLTTAESNISIGLAHATGTGFPGNRVTQAGSAGSSGRGRVAIDYDSLIVEPKDSNGNTLVSAVDVTITADGFTPNKTLGSSTTWAAWLAVGDLVAPPPPAPTLRWLGPRSRVR